MTNLYDDARPDPTFLATPTSALTIGAHPDDAEFGAGGTLAKWAAAGSAITIVVVSDGSKGSWDPDVSTAELIEQRKVEQRAAADELGARTTIHLTETDGEVENTRDLRYELARLIRTFKPEVVLSHDPWRRYMLHPDHRATGMAAVDAVVAARDHLFFPEQGLGKHRPTAMLLWQADEPDHFETIEATFDQKIAALLRHSTQTSTTMGDAGSSDDATEEFVSRMRQIAADFGARADVPLAEGFKLLKP